MNPEYYLYIRGSFHIDVIDLLYVIQILNVFLRML